MIVVTGGAGFIGSAYTWHLNQQNIKDIVISDILRDKDKWKNLSKLNFYTYINRDDLFQYLEDNCNILKTIIHMGACSNTTEYDADYLMKNNLNYSQKLWNFCTKNKIPFIYASSAATYGDGANSYEDNTENIYTLNPLNPYGLSKHLFDKWVLAQKSAPPQYAGLKFFNVYGPNEYHKGKMSSVIFHGFQQIKESGRLKLFKSYKEGYADGMQKRDFIYVKDVVNIIDFFRTNSQVSGIFNIGTGKARTFNDLAKALFTSMNKKIKISYIDMPEYLKEKYQYYTQAEINKLKDSGYTQKLYTLEQGIYDYVTNYLSKEDPYL